MMFDRLILSTAHDGGQASLAPSPTPFDHPLLSRAARTGQATTQICGGGHPRTYLFFSAAACDGRL